MTHHHPSLPLTFLRTFTTTSNLPARPAAAAILHRHATIPPYPHGPSPWYKQSNFGLYGRTRIQFGNRVSDRTEIKTRRKWHPNIRQQRLWSDALARFIRVKVHARVLRTIDKVGGLDEYLLGEKAGRVRELGMGGWALRWRLMRSEKVKERFRAQRRAMGLPEEGWVGAEVRSLSGEVLGEEELKTEERKFDRALDEEERRVERGKEGGLELGPELDFMEEEAVTKGQKITA